jgi:hypothetical protein
MSEADKLVQQAIAAYNGGRIDEARELLLQVVDQDEHHEQGWLWLSAVVDTLEEQQICLENVLAVNPSNQRARKGLDAINNKLAKQQRQSTNAQSPPSSTPPSGRSSSAPIGAEYAESPGDSPFGQSAPDSDPGTGDWFGGAEVSDPDPPETPPTSVDWQPSAGPVAHGSGRQVDQPSNEEYDDWVSSLNLDSGEADTGSQDANDASPFVADSAAPFGDTSFMVDANDAPGSEPAVEKSTFGSDLFGEDAASWSDDPAPFANDVFDAPEPGGAFPDHPAAVNNNAGAPFAEPDNAATLEDELALDDDDDDLLFNFDDDEDSLFGDDDDSEELTSLLGDSGDASLAEYYQYIPDDIEPKAGLNGRAVMLLGTIVLLLLLNLASFGYLVMAL